jgi:RND family efflux transporter MFP subunit
MKFISGFFSGIVVAALLGAVGTASWWIVTAKGPETKQDKHEKPATVAKPAKEDDLNTITLKPEAENRLGVHTGKIEKKAIRRTRVYGGEVTVPVGSSILVSAPLGGTLKAPGDSLPRVGQSVKKGQPIFSLLPLLTPEARTTLASARVDAEGQVKNAQTSVDAAKVALDRAKQLFKDGAGKKRDVDEAQAAYELSLGTLKAAEARRDLLVKTVGEVEKGTAAPITIDSPQDGLLRNLTALPEQFVPGGALLFEIVDLKKVWVRVPVYVGDLTEVAEGEAAGLGNLAARPGEKMLEIRPVAAPPSANPLAATVDLFYEADNASGSLIPGQRVNAILPLRGEGESLVLPWSAVVHDIYGGTWVYEQTAPHTFVRRRVTVRYVIGDQAVVAGGPPAGTDVVDQGAQELFGTETGFSK